MAEKVVTIGVKKIELFLLEEGVVTGDAIVIGDTLEDSLNITQDEGTTVDVNIEESDSPVFSRRIKGAKTIDYQIPNPNNEELAKLWGTYSAEDGFSEPDDAVIVECKMVITPSIGSVMTFNRASMGFASDGSLGKNNALQLSVSANILKPTVAGLPMATYK